MTFKKTCLNFSFSTLVPIVIRVQLESPKAFKFLTITPFLSRELQKFSLLFSSGNDIV